jgi:hypothetical protein
VARRPRVDGAADIGFAAMLGALDRLAELSPALCRALLRIAAFALIPSLRSRWRRSGRAVSARAWTAFAADAAMGLLHPGDCPIVGWSSAPRGTVLLCAHMGPWEAAAATLVGRGERVFAIAAPWPRWPRLAQRVASMRSRHGVATMPRGLGAWRAAITHLACGGVLIALVDSLSPRGRRALPLAGGAVGAADALVGLALRGGYRVAVGTWDGERYTASTLSSGPPGRADTAAVRRLADAAHEALRSAVDARPASWAWVRAAALVALAFGPGCAPELPPLPLDAAGWRGAATAIVWEGDVAGQPMRFDARRANLAWHDGHPTGRFEGVDLRVPGTAAHAWAKVGDGSWPNGPMTFEVVGWDVAGERGSASQIAWTREGRWSCGGCALERVLPGAGP